MRKNVAPEAFAEGRGWMRRNISEPLTETREVLNFVISLSAFAWRAHFQNVMKWAGVIFVTS